MATWACYHVIGDALRGTGRPGDGISPGASRRACARSPRCWRRSPKRSRRLPFVWAAAASVAAVALVGWVAFGTLDPPRPRSRSRARPPACAAAQVRPQPVPADYLLAHQEYSPTTQIQGVGP